MFINTHATACRADLAAAGWSMQRDLGTRLAWEDAHAFILCKATDPTSYIAQDLHRASEQTRQQARQREAKQVAQHMNPAFKHLFT